MVLKYSLNHWIIVMVLFMEINSTYSIAIIAIIDQFAKKIVKDSSSFINTDIKWSFQQEKIGLKKKAKTSLNLLIYRGILEFLKEMISFRTNH